MDASSSGKAIREFKTFKWTDLYLPDQEHLDQIAKQYDLDYLQIKDSLEQGHLPKFEKQPGYNFLILRAFTSTIEAGATTIPELSNKIAFFYNADKIITIHRNAFDFLQKIEQDFSKPEDLLLYMIRKMVLTYQAPFNELDEQIDEFEKNIVLKNYSTITLVDLYYLKAQTRITKKLLLIFQDVINQLEVSKENKTSLQDIKDRLLNLILNYDEVLDSANSLLNTYHSVNAQKTNNTMKLLTIFSAFFLPLSFIAGVYGMNFENMPELKWPLGYFLIVAVMALVATIIFIWFKRKKII
jgi:magnesium transporter